MRRTLRAPVLAFAVLCAGSVPAAAQSREVGATAGSHMHTLLQKTLLRVDVLTVDLCFDESTGQRFAALAARGRLTGRTADSVTLAALSGRRAAARVEFLRDIALRDFLDGVGEDLRVAADAGLVADSVHRAISAGLPGWYAALRQRGIRQGDVLTYHMGPETVRTVLVGREGKTLLDRTEHGRARRNSPLAAWLAPGSQFRAGLLRSLETGRGRGRDVAGSPPCRATLE